MPSTITDANGDVTIQDQNGCVVRKGKTGEVVADNERVVTGHLSTAEVSHSDGTRTRLDQNTTFSPGQRRQGGGGSTATGVTG